MATVAEYTFDASGLSWQQFVDTMLEIKSASELGGISVHVRPPRRCAAEARRVIRDLDLSDCVALIEAGRDRREAKIPVRHSGRPRAFGAIYARLARNVSAWFGAPRGPLHP